MPRITRNDHQHRSLDKNFCERVEENIHKPLFVWNTYLLFCYPLLTSKCSHLAVNIAHSSIDLSALPLLSVDRVDPKND